MLKFYKELKRRNVIKTLGVYGAAAIVITTTAATLFPYLPFLPDVSITFVIVLTVLGFPITFFLSWTYDLNREAELDDKSGHEDTEPDKKSKKILLPISGMLTIIGGAFWFWYSLGNVTSGSDLDLQIGIKKSIAVFDFDNLTGQKDGDHLCSGISQNIHFILTKIGKLDVKSRRSILTNSPKDLDLDYYIDGSLIEIGGNRNIDVSIVNAKSESNLWTGRFEYNDEEILVHQDTIIHSILTKLDISPIGNELTSSMNAYKNPQNFKLIGEGIYHLEQKNYPAALRAFESVLESDPENMIANFHKANTYLELNKYDAAMIIYEDILGQSSEIDPVDWRWPYLERKNIRSLLCTNIEMVEDKDLAIMLLRGNKSCHLLGYNLAQKKIKWEEPIDDQFVSNPVIINNTAFLTSSRVKVEQGGQPTLYAYDIITGGRVLIKEFPRENDDQAVMLNISTRHNNISDDNSTILLSINKFDPGGGGESSRDVALIETTSNSVLWKITTDVGWGSLADFMLLNTEKAELLLLILRHDVIALNYKTGTEVWRENFTPQSRLLIWNQKILEANVEERYLALWDPISRKNVWKSNDGDQRNIYIDISNPNFIRAEFMRRINRDVGIINFTNGDLVAINFDGGFLNWNRTRWTRNVGVAEKIWLSKNASDRMFCLTQDDTLFTINMTDGEIINRIPTDRHNYNIYYDDSKNAMVLNSAEFLIGVDPLNGNQLWKVKDNDVDKARLIGNSVLAVKTVQEDSLIIIKNYNRDNGNLVWGKNIPIAKSLSSFPMVSPVCSGGGKECGFCENFTPYLEPYYDDALLLVLHDEIIKMGGIQSRSHAVRQKDVHLQIARTHEKNGQLNRAIAEYNSLIKKDQMNHNAHWALANIYQKKKDDAKAIKSLIRYYELVLPTSTEGIKTIQKLKKLSGLKWEKNIYWNGFITSEMGIDNERLFLFLDNNVESHSMHSSALIWKSSFGDENTSVVSTDVKSKKNIFFIKKHVPNVNRFYLKDRISGRKIDFEAFKKASKYSLVAMNKRDGDKLWDIPLDITGESDVVWIGTISNKIIIQSMFQNKMSISSYDISGEGVLWETSYDISPLYTSYNLTPAFYNGYILLPLDNKIEYINAENGISSRAYTDEDIDHNIFFFNENSIQDNNMKFFIDEYVYEYIVVDLDKNLKIGGGVLDLDKPEKGRWINNIFVDVSSSGAVTAYKLPSEGENEAAILWRKDYNASLGLLGVDKQNTYLLDKDNNYIYGVGTLSGKEINKTRLLWNGDNVEIRGHYFIVQSANKLYSFPFK